jgi:hypothetical protein
MAERLFGLETEYGIAGGDSEGDGADRDRFTFSLLASAHEHLPCVSDFYGNGVFLASGARFYVDAGHHPEMTTPEVANPWDAVRYVLAGEGLLERMASACPDGQRPLLLKTNVDGLSRSSWGLHESYLHSTDPERLPAQVIPHLVSRVIYTGAGGLNPFAPGIEFVLSPRSLMLQCAVSKESMRERGIFHTRNESLCAGGLHRLHVIAGESLCSETGMWLRSAATAIVVAMIDGGLEPGADVALEDPVAALNAIVRDPACGARVRAGGGEMSALEIQFRLLALAEQHVHADFMPPWAERACVLWRDVLERLRRAPDGVSAVLDWAIKRALFERVLARRGVDWSRVTGPAAASEATAPGDGERVRQLRNELFACDARFSQLGANSIFVSLDEAGVLAHRVPGVDNIEHAMEHPPAVGRARLRGEVIRRVLPKRRTFSAHWEFVLDLEERNVLDLSNPFETEERWGPSEGHILSRSHPLQPFHRQPSQGDLAVDRRYRAYGRFCERDYAGAEALLEELIAEGFELPGTHCHLARTCLVTGRFADARRHAEAAWHTREQAPTYILGRTLWFLTLFSLMDGAGGRPWIGRLKALGPSGAAVLDWTMAPVLEALRPQLSPEVHGLMSALARALSRGVDRVPALCEHGWDAVEAEETEAAQPADAG